MFFVGKLDIVIYFLVLAANTIMREQMKAYNTRSLESYIFLLLCLGCRVQTKGGCSCRRLGESPGKWQQWQSWAPAEMFSILLKIGVFVCFRGGGVQTAPLSLPLMSPWCVSLFWQHNGFITLTYKKRSSEH